MNDSSNFWGGSGQNDRSKLSVYATNGLIVPLFDQRSRVPVVFFTKIHQGMESCVLFFWTVLDV